MLRAFWNKTRKILIRRRVRRKRRRTTVIPSTHHSSWLSPKKRLLKLKSNKLKK
jgi:hypothetical protein